MPTVSYGFFGQIFLLLSTLFDCQKGNSYVSSTLKCRTGNFFVYISPFVFIAIILYTFIALLTNLLYYKSIFISCNNDALQKSSPVPDISLLFTKIAIIYWHKFIYKYKI